MLKSLFLVAGALEREGIGEARLVVVWFEFERALELRRRLRKLFFLGQQQGQVEPGRKELGLQLQSLPVEVNRVGGALHAGVAVGQVEERLPVAGVPEEKIFQLGCRQVVLFPLQCLLGRGQSYLDGARLLLGGALLGIFAGGLGVARRRQE